MTYDHVLVAIDGAIRDWETSGDAMRYVPEGQRKQRSPQLPILDFEAFRRFAANYQQAMQRVARAVIRTAQLVNQHYELKNGTLVPRTSVNPLPLCIDGHEYHRRQQARRRRR